ncbi:SDR family oxidoreductase [Falsiroseomonas sp.]|uniref:SDR family oxidoreductase n=1 Tax=Falsiroseomonas sp. TaxID=2870721 RepID=UPI0035654147
MSGLLAGRIAAVTGGARGLGAAIAARFRAEGAAVVTLDLDGADERCDVADEAQVAAAFGRIGERHGRLDVLVANAGLVPPWRELTALDMAEWDRIFAVNVRGVALCLKHGVPLMPRGGSVVAMGSIMSERGAPRQALYNATKHAVLGIVRVAAQELGPRGIRVNAVGPGPVATEALHARIATRAASGLGPAPEQALADYDSETPLGRAATAEEVAKATLFLASDLASAITGRLLRVDGGLT